MDSIPHPSPVVIQELQTDSRTVSLKVVPNDSIPKGKKSLMISVRNYLSVCFGGTRLCSYFSSTVETDTDQKSSTTEKIVCQSRSGISGGI